MTKSYPAGVRAWIKKRGGLTRKVIYLRGGMAEHLASRQMLHSHHKPRLTPLYVRLPRGKIA